MSRESTSVGTRKSSKGPVIFLLILGTLVGFWLGVPTYQKTKADAMVRELCAKDGGMKVYEIVKLPAERFDKNGNVMFGTRWGPPLKQLAKEGDDFYHTSETTWIIPETGIGSLAMWRSHQKLFRFNDQKLLGEAITYSRRGGDPIGPWHPSSFGCPPNTGNTLERQVFVKQ